MEKFVEERPWGKFEQYTHNEVSTVKILTANPNSKLSYQYHKNRDEFWKILKGSGQVVINDEIKDAKEGDEFFIKRGDKHRIMTKDESVDWMEISFGEFDENDNIRIEDDYGRSE